MTTPHDIFDTVNGPLIHDTSALTPEVLDRHPIWVSMLPSVRCELAARAGVPEFSEASRVAYTGPLPYPLFADDGVHPDYPDIRCTALAPGNEQYRGYLEYAEDLCGLYATVFTPYGKRSHGRQSVILGEIPPARYEEVVPRWRDTVEAAFARPLSELFPMTLSVEPGLLPAEATTTWTLPGLIYFQNREQQVVPLE